MRHSHIALHHKESVAARFTCQFMGVSLLALLIGLQMTLNLKPAVKGSIMFLCDIGSKLPQPATIMLKCVDLGTSIPEFGFVFPRCVRTAIQNKFWRENYRCIRALFPQAPIVIIEDYSDASLVDQNFTMTGTVVVPSELPPGRGEALPHLYFHRHKPFKKAVMLKDGIFILKREPLWSALQNTTDYRFLWYFDQYQAYGDPTKCALDHLRPEVRGRLGRFYNDSAHWVGCFGSMAIMTWDFLDRLDTAYGFVNMLRAVENRPHREALERMVGLLSIHNTGGMRLQHKGSVYGSIFTHRQAFTYSYADYVRDKAAGVLKDDAIIKIWNGRRRF